MEVTESPSFADGYAVLTLDGEIDVLTGPQLRTALTALAETPQTHVVVDMSRVTFLDSSGLGVLVGGLKRLRTSGGSLRLAGCQSAVAELLRITGLDSVFHPFATVQDAAADLKA